MNLFRNSEPLFFYVQCEKTEKTKNSIRIGLVCPDHFKPPRLARVWTTRRKGTIHSQSCSTSTTRINDSKEINNNNDDDVDDVDDDDDNNNNSNK